MVNTKPKPVITNIGSIFGKIRYKFCKTISKSLLEGIELRKENNNNNTPIELRTLKPKSEGKKNKIYWSILNTHMPNNKRILFKLYKAHDGTAITKTCRRT
jgi:hypothetical protein